MDSDSRQNLQSQTVAGEVRECVIERHELNTRGNRECRQISIHPDVRRCKGPARQLQPELADTGWFLDSRNRRVAIYSIEILDGLLIRERDDAATAHDFFLSNKTKKTNLGRATKEEIADLKRRRIVPAPCRLM